MLRFNKPREIRIQGKFYGKRICVNGREEGKLELRLEEFQQWGIGNGALGL